MQQPTPTGGELRVIAWVKKASTDRALVAGHIEADGVVTARGEGTFVAVKDGCESFRPTLYAVVAVGYVTICWGEGPPRGRYRLGPTIRPKETPNEASRVHEAKPR